MESHNDTDYLNFANDKEILRLIRNEDILFTDSIIKVNRYNMSQERYIIITSEAIYNLHKKSIKRRIPLTIIGGITVSKLTDELVIHGLESEYDYHYVSQRRRKIISVINDAYFKANRKKLKLFEIDERSLKDIVTSKKEKKANPRRTKMIETDLIDIDKFLAETRISVLSSSYQPIETHPQTETLYSKHKTVQTVKYEDFQLIKVIGKGSYGKICFVVYTPTNEKYAMKCYNKHTLIEKDQISNILQEKEILQAIDHPLVCNLIFCFQTFERIFFVMPYLPGGQLFTHLQKAKIFDEERVRFYGAQIALALQYLHGRKIIFRDLKPENILMDSDGYVRLTDFGVAKKLKENEKANSFCGTPDYIAPEIINREGHNHAVDWWSFGTLIYEMLCGIPPFYIDNIDKMYKLITESEVKFPLKIPLSADAKDLLIKLLEKNPEKRLGTKGGIKEIQSHPFFALIDFDMICNKKLPAPFIPTITDDYDVQNYDDSFTKEDIDLLILPNHALKEIDNHQQSFEHFNK